MYAWMIGLVATSAVFGAVILVHELGHFLAAKAAGVYAPVFSLGLGRPLWRTRWGETEYRVSRVPLGGFVRLASRDDDPTVAPVEGVAAPLRPGDPGYDPAALVPFGPLPVPSDRLLESKRLGVRVGILAAGVGMNLLLGFLALTSVAVHHGNPTIETRVVGGVRPLSGLEWLSAAIQVGDTILAVDGEAVEDWIDIVQRIRSGHAETLVITTQLRTVELTPLAEGPAWRERVAYALEPFFTPVIAAVAPEGAAAAGGLLPGDSIVAVEGEPIRSWPQVRRWVERSPGRELEVVARRGDHLHTLKLRPTAVVEANPLTGETEQLGRIGVTLRPLVSREPISTGEAFARGARATLVVSGLVVTAVGRLLSGQMPAEELSGPIALAQQSAGAATRGLVHVLGVLAFLSINVGLLNLLPIPVLDGGQIVLSVVEAVKGEPLSARTRGVATRAGLLLLIAVLALVMMQDLLRLAEG